MNILYVIRQRRLALLTVFLSAAAVYVLFALFFTHTYTAYAQVSDTNARTAGNITPQNNISVYIAPLKSDTLIQKVAVKLNAADREKLLAPFTPWLQWGARRGVAEVLMEGRRIMAADRLVDVGFQHPDPAVSAQIANAMAEEFVRESTAAKDDRLKNNLGELRTKADEEQTKIAGLQRKMKDLTDQYDMTSFNANGDSIYLSIIQDLNKQVIQLKAKVDTLDLQRQQVENQLKDNKPVWDLDFIRSKPNISQLYQSAITQQNHVQELQTQGYQEEAPAMVDAKRLQAASMQELISATEAAVRQFVADYQSLQNNYLQASNRLQDMQQKNQDLAGARAIYNGLHKQFETENQVYSKLQIALADAETQFKLTDPNYAVLAKAEPPSKADALPWRHMALIALSWGAGGSVLVLLGFMVFRPPPKEEREEYERRRRRHRHFHSSSSRSSSRSSESGSRSSGSSSRSSESRSRSDGSGSRSSESSRHRH